MTRVAIRFAATLGVVAAMQACGDDSMPNDAGAGATGGASVARSSASGSGGTSAGTGVGGVGKGGTAAGGAGSTGTGGTGAPTVVPGPLKRHIAAAWQSVTGDLCVIQPDDTLFCDSAGGSGPFFGRIQPDDRFQRIVLTEGDVRSIGCAIRLDGTLLWTDPSALPWDPPPSDQTFLDVDFAEQDACGVLSDGTLACWGGPLGYPEILSPPAGQFTQVSVISGLACALRVDGAVVCWGGDLTAYREAKDGFASLVAAGEQFAQVQALCALGTDGSFVCPASDTPLPQGPFIQLAPSGSDTCLLGADGRVDCLGGAQEPTATYAEIGRHSCGIQTDGVVSCWGTESFDIPTDLHGKVD